MGQVGSGTCPFLKYEPADRLDLYGFGVFQPVTVKKTLKSNGFGRIRAGRLELGGFLPTPKDEHRLCNFILYEIIKFFF